MENPMWLLLMTSVTEDVILTDLVQKRLIGAAMGTIDPDERREEIDLAVVRDLMQEIEVTKNESVIGK